MAAQPAAEVVALDPGGGVLGDPDVGEGPVAPSVEVLGREAGARPPVLDRARDGMAGKGVPRGEDGGDAGPGAAPGRPADDEDGLVLAQRPAVIDLRVQPVVDYVLGQGVQGNQHAAGNAALEELVAIPNIKHEHIGVLLHQLVGLGRADGISRATQHAGRDAQAPRHRR